MAEADNSNIAFHRMKDTVALQYSGIVGKIFKVNAEKMIFFLV